jgi:hypothetical protein
MYNRIADIKGHYDYRRWLWLRSLKDPTKNIAKLISIEDIPFPLTPDAFKIDQELREGKFIVAGKEYIGEDFFKNHAELTGIERTDFKDYWNHRLGIAKNAFKEFHKANRRKPRSKIEPPPELTPQQPPENKEEASSAGAALARKRWKKN